MRVIPTPRRNINTYRSGRMNIENSEVEDGWIDAFLAQSGNGKGADRLTPFCVGGYPLPAPRPSRRSEQLSQEVGGALLLSVESAAPPRWKLGSGA